MEKTSFTPKFPSSILKVPKSSTTQETAHIFPNEPSSSISSHSKKSGSIKKFTASFDINSKLTKKISLNKQIEKLRTSVDSSEERTTGKLPSLGPLKIDNLEQFLIKSKIDFEKLFSANPTCSLQISDFTIIKKLGKGTFGKVILAELKKDETLYAIKLIEKIEVVKKNYVRYVINEKRILQSINFPFVVQLNYFFVDYKYMYFVMPFIPGGDFNHYLFRHKLIKESNAKFYIGQLILALEYLHYLDLIHRDVKPENIILDVFGYIKLGDFGQCIRCFNNDKTWTVAGTPEYMAPEIIVGKGYDCAVDWWSLGVFTFEICAGELPFVNRNVNSLYQLILTVKYRFPEHFSRQLKNFVKGLLVNNPNERLANRTKKATKIKAMSWLKETDWLGLLNRNILAPYKPEVLNIPTNNSTQVNA